MLQQFQVKGMSCGHCVRAVTLAVQSIDPKAEVKVDLNQAKVDIQSDKPREALAKAIADQGYAVAA